MGAAKAIVEPATMNAPANAMRNQRGVFINLEMRVEVESPDACLSFIKAAFAIVILFSPCC
jgi:hypothetical protein